MKNALGLLVLVVLAAGLMGFAFDRNGPGTQAGKAGLSSDAAAQAPAVIVAAAQPVAYVVTGLAFVLFGVLAVGPLVLNDSAR